MGHDIETIWQRIKTERDELRVQLELGKAEFKDEWESLEDRFQLAERKLHQLQHESAESATELKKSAGVIVEEISSAYDRIRNRLRD